MRIAVTGGSGNIGTYVCNQFKDAGDEVAALDIRPPEADVAFVKVDLCDLEATQEAIAGFDQIVHLAAIPDPYKDPAERVMSVNMTSTFNLFEAAHRQGISRVIYGCSESSTGFGIHEVALAPLYLPVDEAHPCWPHETYSLSKHFGERIGDNYAHAFGLEVVSLRYAWVWDKRCIDAAKGIVARARAGDLGAGDPWFGAYIAVHDVAGACLAASRYRFPTAREYPYEAFFLTARDTFYALPTLEVLARVFDPLPEVRDQAYFDANPHASVFDIRKAQRLLGWQPRFDALDFEKWLL